MPAFVYMVGFFILVAAAKQSSKNVDRQININKSAEFFLDEYHMSNTSHFLGRSNFTEGA